MVLGPNDKRGPVAAWVRERLVERVQLRRRHADVDRALADRDHVRAGVTEKLIELPAQRVVTDLEFLGGLALVVNVEEDDDNRMSRRRPNDPDYPKLLWARRLWS